MEKLIYALWRDPSEPRAAFNARLLGPIAATLAPLVRALRINVQDEAVAGGTSPRLAVTRPQMEAVIQLWVDTSWPDALAPVAAAIAGAGARHEGWLVSESAPIVNRLPPPAPGARTEGFSQIAFLIVPRDMEREAWRRVWQDGHTAVGIETQSNFEYIQNLVVRPVTASAGDYAAIVEECFPMAALADEVVYYDAAGNPARLAAHKARMTASCARFIGAEGCDCIPTSQFDLKRA